MIKNDRELEVTQDRVRFFERQAAMIRKIETNPENYRTSVSGFLAEIDRMNLEIREYLSSIPVDMSS